MPRRRDREKTRQTHLSEPSPMKANEGYGRLRKATEGKKNKKIGEKTNSQRKDNDLC
jgi:hypothetical protein